MTQPHLLTLWESWKCSYSEDFPLSCNPLNNRQCSNMQQQQQKQKQNCTAIHLLASRAVCHSNFEVKSWWMWWWRWWYRVEYHLDVPLPCLWQSTTSLCTYVHRERWVFVLQIDCACKQCCAHVTTCNFIQWKSSPEPSAHIPSSTKI